MTLIDKKLLDSVSEKAKESERLRMNYNFHELLDSPAQRLLNALEPGTILPIHRHTNTAETYILLCGAINVFFYNDKAEKTESFSLSKETACGIHIPAGQWHTLEVLESGTVIFEVKDGPYTPLDETNIMSL